MAYKFPVLILTVASLAGCGAVRDSALNPLNWFGASTSRPVADAANPLIPQRGNRLLSKKASPEYTGQLVGTVTELAVEQRPGGAVIRATGVADRQGAFLAKLIKDESAADPSVLVYDLRAVQGPGAAGGGEASRAVTVAVWLTDQELAGIREIAVRGARNIRSARR